MPGKANFRVATTAIGLGVAFCTQFAPVPYLAPAATVCFNILVLCNNVQTNKNGIRNLGRRCEALLLTLKDNTSLYTPQRLEEIAQASEQLLEDIHAKVSAWSGKSSFHHFFNQGDITDEIQRCHMSIDNFLASFQISSQSELHDWQRTFQEETRRDHEELIAYLADIGNQQQIMKSTMEARMQGLSGQITGIMSLVQDRLGSLQIGDQPHRHLSHILHTVQQQSHQLLPDYNLRRGEVRRVGSHPVGGNAGFDIWEGIYLDGEKVAIKAMRGIEVTPRIQERFIREAKIWRTLWEIDKGTHILPFYGAVFDDGPYPYMVSPWMQYGDALHFVKKFPDVNRKKLIRRVAEGLRLLHSQNPPIAHGDLKAANILINSSFQPLIADFGLSKIMEELTGMPFTQSRGVSDSYRWFAPELCSSTGILSTCSDIFAFAMTVLEIMTSAPPFAEIKRTPEVLIHMQNGARPRRPENPEVVQRGLDDKLWDLLTRCWVTDSAQRPTIVQVLEELPVE